MFLVCVFNSEVVYKIKIRRHNNLFDSVIGKYNTFENLNILLFVHLNKNNKDSKEFVSVIGTIIDKMNELSVDKIYIYI